MRPWSTVALGDLADSVDYGVTASATLQPIGPKFLRITDIQNGAVDWNGVPWCECDPRSAADSRLRPGDIVFARTGATTGKSFLIRQCPTDAVFASYLIRVRLGTAAEPGYVSHFFQTPDYWSQVAKGARGIAQPGVNATTLKALRIPCPPLAEQRRIAAILDQAETLRTKRRFLAQRLDALIESLFVERFGDSNANPNRWPIMPLGDVGKVQGGLQVSAARSRLPEVVPYLRVANVYRDLLDIREVKTLRATSAEVARTLLLRDDLLFVEGHGNPEEIGRCALWDGSIRRCVHQNHLIRVRLDSTKVEPVFVSRYLNSPGGRRDLLRSAKTTSGLNTISVANVRDARLIVPRLSLQREFAQEVAMVERLKTLQRASWAKLDALFASLQHRAFRDEL